MYASAQKGSVVALSPVDVLGPRAKFNSPKVDRAPRRALCESKNIPLVKRPAPRVQAQSISPSAAKSRRQPPSPYAQPNSPIASARKPSRPLGSPVKAPLRDEQKGSPRAEQKMPIDAKSLPPQTPPDSAPEPESDDSASEPPATPVKNKTMFSPSYSEPEHVPEEEQAPSFEEEFDPWSFIKNLPPLSSLPLDARLRRILPKKHKQAPSVCLALDLDETLVHCSVEPIKQADLTFSVNFNGIDYQVYVRKRPYLKEFLRIVSQWFEIVVFTASQRVYADKLLTLLDPTGKYIAHRVFRDSCVCVDGNYLKDLSVLGRDIRKVAIIDNSVQAFGYQLNNGIPIESWFDDDGDKELLKLLPFLNRLKDMADVRHLIKETFRLEEYVFNRGR